MLLFALRWGIEPGRSEPLTIFGPAGLERRMASLAEAFGTWVTAPSFPLVVEELDPGEERDIGSGVILETMDTPHTDESMAYGIRYDGRRLVYTGDTSSSAALETWAADCDLLLCECSLPEERAVPLHLTPTQAGAFARHARARRLVLTHFYPVFGSTDPVAVASREFSGEIVAARDGDRFTIQGA